RRWELASDAAWKRAVQQARQLGQQVRTLPDAYLVIRHLLRSLQDLHSNALPPEDLWDQEYQDDLGIDWIPIQTTHGIKRVIYRVGDGSLAAKADVREGDQLLAIDEVDPGQPRLLYGAADLTLLRADRILHVRLNWDNQTGYYRNNPRPRGGLLQPGDVGYIELPENAPLDADDVRVRARDDYAALVQQIMAALDPDASDQPVDRWVVDLRRNGGGRTTQMVQG